MNHEYQNQKKKKFYLYPIIISIGWVPLIVRYSEFESRLGETPWYSQGIFTDVFNRVKAQVFMVTCIIMAVFFLYSFFKGERRKKPFTALIPIGIFAFMAFLSSVTSKYSYFSLGGIPEHFESLGVLLGYCILIFYSYWFIDDIRDMKIVLKGLLIGCMILCLIGVGQWFSLDFYRTSLAEKLLLPAKLWNKNAINFEFEAGRVYTSLYNPNYIGSYVSLLAPIFFAVFLGSKKNKIIYALLLISLVFCLFGSKSLTGIISLLAAVVFVLFFLFRNIFRNKMVKSKKIPIPIGLVFITMALVTTIWGGIWFTGKMEEKNAGNQRDTQLSNIQTNENNVTIEYNGEKLVIECNVMGDGAIQLLCQDGKGNILPYYPSEDNSSYYMDADPFREIMIQPLYYSDYEIIAFGVCIEGEEWNFTNQMEDGTYYYINKFGKFDKIQHPKQFFPARMSKMASGRVGIWSKTIPLLKKYLFLGSGADTFLLVYPNSDYVEDYLAGGNGRTVISKPHNMYLQMAVQTGMVSLIAFLVFYGIYFINSIKLYWNRKENTIAWWIGLGIFAGTLGYMISGIANDSTVCVAPVFWGVFGMGMAVNHFLHIQQLFWKE